MITHIRQNNIVTYEPKVNIQDFKKMTNHFGGYHRIYPSSIKTYKETKKHRKPERCEHLTRQTWRHWDLDRLCPKFSPRMAERVIKSRVQCRHETIGWLCECETVFDWGLTEWGGDKGMRWTYLVVLSTRFASFLCSL